jgi:hypothetical protein
MIMLKQYEIEKYTINELVDVVNVLQLDDNQILICH